MTTLPTQDAAVTAEEAKIMQDTPELPPTDADRLWDAFIDLLNREQPLPEGKPHEAIRNLLEDNTGDNATCVVREVLRAALAVAAADEGRDAARYRWLRNPSLPVAIYINGEMPFFVDTAIDAALAASQGEHQEKQG